MITATAWVRRGVATQFPQKYEIDEVEIERISKLARLQLEDAQEDLEDARKGEAAGSDDEDAEPSVKTGDVAQAKDAAAKMDEYVGSAT